MSKYEKFIDFLNSQPVDTITCSFKQIEDLIGERLTTSASSYDAWWSNHPSHPLMKLVLDSGWIKTKVDLEGHHVTFSRNTDSAFSYEDLNNFLTKEMIMFRNYQPVIIKALLEFPNFRVPYDIIVEKLKEANNSEHKDYRLIAYDVQREVLEKFGKRNLVLKDDQTKDFVLNINKNITEDQRQNLIRLCDEKITEISGKRKIQYYIALGPWSNWDYTIKHPPFRWGIRDSSASNVGVYDSLKEGDIVFYYANQDPPTPFSKRGLFGVGKVTRKYIENNEKYWPDEHISNKVIYKHRFEIENLKLVMTNEELLPWIEGLPFTKGLNHIVDQRPLEKLLEQTRIKWNLDLTQTTQNLNESRNYLLLRHTITRDSPWSDEFGKSYHFGKIANYTKLTSGSKVIWYDKSDGKYQFLGYGNVGNIREETIGDDLWAEMRTFEKFEPPKSATPELRSKITNLPNFNIQHSIVPITREIYDEIVYGKETIAEPLVDTFDDESLPTPTKDDLKQGYEKISDELLIPEEKITEIITALASGRHVLLAGPIGTGKTELARRIPEIFWERYGGYYSEDHTATSDWSTQDVIGGIFPKMGKNGTPIYEIQNGCVTETVQKNWLNVKDDGPRRPSTFPVKTPPYRGTWLIIDEFNRADIDKAFGQLFTALRTRTLKIPTDKEGQSYKTLKIPLDYRIIGTLNTADKHFLFQLSDALKSRFAYIEIDIPDPGKRDTEIYYAMKNAISDLKNGNYDDLISLDHQNKRIDKEKSNPEFYNRVYQAYTFLDSVRLFKKLGTAILKLVYQNMLTGTKITGDTKTALDNALTSNLIPQLENLSQTAVGAIHALYNDNVIKFFKDAYKNPNRQSYSDAFTKIVHYLQLQAAQRLATEFANGTLQVDNDSAWQPIQTAYDTKKKELEMDLDQLKQSMTDLVKSMVI